MTVPDTARRAGPFNGNGVTTVFPFSFKVFSTSPLLVVRGSDDGFLETNLVLGTDYSVTLNPNQDSSPGGVVNYPLSGAPLPAGQTLTVVGNEPYDQTLDLPPGGAFRPISLENALDRATFQIQQLAESLSRALRLAVSSGGVSTSLPPPEANNLLGWNSGATALQNFNLSDLFSAAVYADYVYDTFVGNGSTVNFVLAKAPGNLANMDVSVAGVTKVPGVDYTLSGKTLAFTSGAPPAGQIVLVRYGQSVQQVSAAFSTETQVAVAGQTVFALNELVYEPGTSSLAVYVNGLRFVPGEDYFETDATSVTFESGLAEGDEVFFLAGRVLNDAFGGEQVSYLAPFPGAQSRSGTSKWAEWVTPLDFGAVGDGAFDDTVAVQLALASGQPLDWLDRTYRVTSTVAQTYTGNLRWRSSGATVRMTTPQQYAVLDVAVGAGDHSIDGPLTVDAALNAYVGVRVQAIAGTPDLRVNGVTVTNPYRSGLLFVDGDGFLVRGPFQVVTMNDMVVRNCRMAVGAGVGGVSGIFGISLLSNAFGQPKFVTMNNPTIDWVGSEDPLYLADQDGLRFIVSNGPTDVEQITWDISGGVIRNCFGRGVKSQCETTTVRGTKFIRTEGFSRGYGNEEIDFQEGGGLVRDIQCIYIGSAAETVVHMQTSRDAKATNSGTVDGAHVFVAAGTKLLRFFTNVPALSNSQVIRVSNVDIVGPGTLQVFGAFYGTGDAQFTLFLTDISAAPAIRFVSASLRATGSATGTLKASRVINTGPAPTNMISQLPAWPCLVSMNDCVNFIKYSRGHSILGETAAGSGFQAVQGLIPEGVEKAGVIRPYSFTLDNDEVFTIPSGTCVAGNASNLLFVAVSDSTRGSQALLAAGDDGVVNMTSTATNWTASTTINEPLSGLYRCWRSGGLNISNRSGATATFTALLIG